MATLMCGLLAVVVSHTAQATPAPAHPAITPASTAVRQVAMTSILAHAASDSRQATPAEQMTATTPSPPTPQAPVPWPPLVFSWALAVLLPLLAAITWMDWRQRRTMPL